MSLIKTEAVVVKQRDFSEADKILTLYSLERGKISCIAKGIKKTKSKLRGSLLPFSYTHLVLFQGKSLYTITGADIVESFIHLRNDFNLLAYSSYIVELLDSLVLEEEPNRELFILVISTFHLLKVIDPQLVIKTFEIRSLRILGYRPLTDCCVNCGKKESIYWFSSSQGGVLCSNCSTIDPGGIKIRAGALKTLEYLDKVDLQKISRLKPSKKDIRELDAVLENYIKSLLQKKLNSREFLKTLLSI